MRVNREPKLYQFVEGKWKPLRVRWYLRPFLYDSEVNCFRLRFWLRGPRIPTRWLGL